MQSPKGFNLIANASKQFKKTSLPDVVVHTSHASSQEAEVLGSQI